MIQTTAYREQTVTYIMLRPIHTSDLCPSWSGDTVSNESAQQNSNPDLSFDVGSRRMHPTSVAAVDDWLVLRNCNQLSVEFGPVPSRNRREHNRSHTLASLIFTVTRPILAPQHLATPLVHKAWA